MTTRDLKDRSGPLLAYVSRDGSMITTQAGFMLMTVLRSRPVRTHGKDYSSIHAVDVHGGHWAGRGSEGVAIKLRPVKGAA